jgi:hypothetical protein
MLAHLAEQLEVPLRERNQMLLAAGYAPAFAQTGLGEPAMLAVRSAVGKVLASHDPYPAVVVDGNWDVVEANLSFTVFTDDVAPELLVPPVNVLRLTLHPHGTAPRILNLGQWRAHLLDRLRLRIAIQPWLTDLHRELSGYPCDRSERPEVPRARQDMCVPLRIRSGDRELAFFAVLASFGAPRDVTVDELVIESFYPADARTIAALNDR